MRSTQYKNETTQLSDSRSQIESLNLKSFSQTEKPTQEFLKSALQLKHDLNALKKDSAFEVQSDSSAIYGMGTEVDINEAHNKKVEAALEDLNKQVKKQTGCDLNRINHEDDISGEISRPKSFIDKFKQKFNKPKAEESQPSQVSEDQPQKQSFWSKLSNRVSNAINTIKEKVQNLYKPSSNKTTTDVNIELPRNQTAKPAHKAEHHANNHAVKPTIALTHSLGDNLSTDKSTGSPTSTPQSAHHGRAGNRGIS